MQIPLPMAFGKVCGVIVFGLFANGVCTAQCVMTSTPPVSKSSKSLVATEDSISKGCSAVPFPSLSSLSLGEKIHWPTEFNLEADPTVGSVRGCSKKRAYIVHIAKWAVGDNSEYYLDSSEWYFYHQSGKQDRVNPGQCSLKRNRFQANGQPLLYGDKDALIIGITLFEHGKEVSAKDASILYKFSATPSVPENIQNLSTLISALLGAQTAGGLQASKGARPTSSDTFLALAYLPGTRRLPSNFNITYSLTPKKSASEQVLPEGTVGVDYKAPISIKGGKSPYTFATSNGDLPSGLSFDSQNLEIVGTPTAAGKFEFDVQIQDSSNPPVKSTVTASIVIKQMTVQLGDTQSQQPTGGTNQPKPAADENPTKNPSDNENQSGSKAQVVDCTATNPTSPCKLSRSFLSEDREYFDFGLAVSVPGVNETEYKTSTNGFTSSTTRHTDAYAMVDLYPFAHWSYKENGVFHFLVGLPVTGNPFYRPFFGGAIDLTGWTGLRRIGFPLQMSAFGGVVYMKEQILVGSPSPNSLISTRVVKGMFGIELPVSALINKIGRAAKGSTAKTSGP